MRGRLLDVALTDRSLVASALWHRMDVPAFDLCRLWGSHHAHAFEGRVLTIVDDAPTEIGYAVECDERWVTRFVHVEVIRPSSIDRMDISRDKHGRWRRGGTPLPMMDGIQDVDLEITPATNTLPIRRMSLDVGESADVRAVWIRFPDLEIELLPQRYTRTAEKQYRYESAGGAYTATLEVDAFGLVHAYADTWKRLDNLTTGPT